MKSRANARFWDAFPELQPAVREQARQASLAPTDQLVYIVQITMKRYSAAGARQNFADVLDEAERGEAVVIERRGVQFELRPLRRAKQRVSRPSLILDMDASVAEGQWTWQLDAKGFRFRARRGKSK